MNYHRATADFAGRAGTGGDAMNDAADDRYQQCVKDLDPDLHVGGYPARAIVIETAPGWFVLYKANLRPDTAINLARSIARNEEQSWFKIHCVNQKLKTRVDTISKVRAET